MSRRPIRLLLVASVGVIGLFASAVAVRSSDTAGPCVVAQPSKRLPPLPEASGLAISRRNAGMLWAHNDSGNAAVLMALDATGALRGRVRVPIATRDWEDVSVGRCQNGSCVYIADIGDNTLQRRRIQIYRVPEPRVGDSETASPEVFMAAYADGPHNAEAVFVVGTDLFVVTKDRVGGLYRLAGPMSTGRELRLERIGQLGLELVTDAESSTDETSVAVRTQDVVNIYNTAEIVRGGTVRPRLSIPVAGLRESQGEGVALDSGGMLYLVSEGRPWTRGGSFTSLRCVLP